MVWVMRVLTESPKIVGDCLSKNLKNQKKCKIDWRKNVAALNTCFLKSLSHTDWIFEESFSKYFQKLGFLGDLSKDLSGNLSGNLSGDYRRIIGSKKLLNFSSNL